MHTIRLCQETWPGYSNHLDIDIVLLFFILGNHVLISQNFKIGAWTLLYHVIFESLLYFFYVSGEPRRLMCSETKYGATPGPLERMYNEWDAERDVTYLGDRTLKACD